jgi:hypothetical protein
VVTAPDAHDAGETAVLTVRLRVVGERFVDPRLPPRIRPLFGFRKQLREHVRHLVRLLRLELEIH